MADRTIVFPHPPSERWTSNWWNPRITALALVAGLVGAIAIVGQVGAVMMHRRNANLKRWSSRDMSFVVSHHSTSQLPASMVLPPARDQLVKLDENFGPILTWHVEETYSQLFGTGGGAIVFVHRRGGDMRLVMSYDPAGRLDWRQMNGET